jgi:D-alanyl-D-alanine carboxypeptidase/D-alanyl-D-alanine-endopeptidase (penicillin-binding protein 4)
LIFDASEFNNCAGEGESKTKRPRPDGGKNAPPVYFYFLRVCLRSMKTHALIFILIVSAVFSSCVSLPGNRMPSVVVPTETSIEPPLVPEAPEFDAAAWFATRAPQPEFQAALVETLAPGKKFADYNTDKVFNPASLVKLATSLAALKKLGAEHRFPVKVFADGKIENGALAGDLYLMGNPPIFNELSALVIADELKNRGVERIAGTIYVSPRFTFNFHEHADESAKLLAPNLKLKSRPSTGVAEQPRGTELFTFKSYTLREVLLYMNTFSSNFVAHRVGDEIGSADGVRNFLISGLGFAPEKVRLQTTSGLEENNGLTAREIFEILRALDAELKRQNLNPVDVLPTAANGTLRHRLAETNFKTATIGKTGTLSTADGGIGMASFAGLIYTKNYGPVAYVLISEGAQTAVHKKMQDEFLREILDCQIDPVAFENETKRQLLPKAELQIEASKR